jgi:hypothetical protein
MNHPRATAKKIKHVLGLLFSIDLISGIVYNRDHADPEYHPQMSGHAIGYTVEPRHATRKPSYLCRYKCKTCGSGYDVESEVDECCKKSFTGKGLHKKSPRLFSTKRSRR